MAISVYAKKTSAQTAIEPFLLPLCPDCNGATCLSGLSPHPTESAEELRIYRCSDCGAQHTFARKRR
jgi:hypothetical protein